jgi:hypothetical protein
MGTLLLRFSRGGSLSPVVTSVLPRVKEFGEVSSIDQIDQSNQTKWRDPGYFAQHSLTLAELIKDGVLLGRLPHKRLQPTQMYVLRHHLGLSDLG